MEDKMDFGIVSDEMIRANVQLMADEQENELEEHRLEQEAALQVNGEAVQNAEQMEAQQRERRVRERIREYRVDTGSLQVFMNGMATTRGVNANMTSSKRSMKRNISFTELGRKKSNAAKIQKAAMDLREYKLKDWTMELDEDNQRSALEEFAALDFSTLRLGADREFVDSIPTLQRIFLTMERAEKIYEKEYENQPELKEECERKIRQAKRLKLYFDIRSSVITDPVYKNYKNSEIGKLERSHNSDEYRLYRQMELLKEAAELLEFGQEDDELDEREMEMMQRLENRFLMINQEEAPVRRANSNSLTFTDMTGNSLPMVSHLQTLREERGENGHRRFDRDDDDRRTAYREHEEEYRAYQTGTLRMENSRFGEEEIKLLRSLLSCLNPRWDVPLHERRDEAIRLQKMYQFYINKNEVQVETLRENSQGVEKLLYDIHKFIVEPFYGNRLIPAGVKNKQYDNPKLSTTQFYVSKKDEKLFCTQPCVTDIQQRTVSDCYLLSALTSIVYTDPKMIMERMIDNGDTVSVRFVDSETDIVMHEELTLDESVSDQVCLEKLLSKYGDDRKSLLAEQMEEEIDDDFLLVGEKKEEQTDEQKAEQRKKEERIRIYQMLGGNNARRFSAIAETLCGMKNSKNEQEQKLAQQVDELLRSVKSQQIEEENAFSEFVDAIVREGLFETLERVTSHAGDQRIDIEEYVTVSKEIPRYLGVVDANAANSLWVQMIEKAFAARFAKDGKYENLSYNTSFYFLEHFLGSEYRSTGRNQIVERNLQDIRTYFEGSLCSIPAADIEQAINDQRRRLKEQNYPNGVYEPDIEMVVEALKEQGYDYEDDAWVSLVDQLEHNMGLTYGIFDLKYSDAAESLYEELERRLADGQIITVGRAEQDESLIDRLNEDGIRANHAYAVLAVEENTDGAKSVILKDPYCRFRRIYSNQTDGVREEMTVTGANTYIHLDQDDSSGIFRVTLNDFMQIFNEYSGRKG